MLTNFIDFLNNLSSILNEYLISIGMLAPIFSSILIIAEGILAFLPLVVFVTINIYVLGPIIGGIISWFFTFLGSLLAFLLFRKGFNKLFQKKITHNDKLKRFMSNINNLKFKQLVLIIAIPFSPSFFINLGAGLSEISIKKYIYALLVGKFFVILFLGYIGSSFIECLTNPFKFIEVVILVIFAYLIAQFINKKYDLDGRF